MVIMKIFSIFYFISEAFKSIVKNRLMTFASVLTVASCITILVISISLAMNITYLLENFESNIGISSFIEDNLTSAKVEQLYKEISEMEEVESVKYITKEEAFYNFEQSLGDEKYILEGLPKDELLPRSFEIYLKDNSLLDSFITKIEVYENTFTSVKYAKDETNTLMAINDSITYISLSLIVVLGFISVIIITNTIKTALNNRKTEINIMKYIGATNWFIRWPFVIEGIIIGFLGALIPLGILYFSYNKVTVIIFEEMKFLANFLTFVPVEQLLYYTMPISFIFGISIGVAGSLSSIHKYLKV